MFINIIPTNFQILKMPYFESCESDIFYIVKLQNEHSVTRPFVFIREFVVKTKSSLQAWLVKYQRIKHVSSNKLVGCWHKVCCGDSAKVCCGDSANRFFYLRFYFVLWHHQRKYSFVYYKICCLWRSVLLQHSNLVDCVVSNSNRSMTDCVII